MKVQIEYRQYQRLKVLIELYKISEASTFKAFDLRLLSYQIGIKNGNYDDIQSYLKNEKLIKNLNGTMFFITHDGIKFVESNYKNVMND